MDPAHRSSPLEPMPFIFDHTRTLSEQLKEIGVDRDSILEASDEYGVPEAELVQFWLDLYGERDASCLRGPSTKDDLCSEPAVEWELAVQGYSWEQHSAGDILEVLAELGCYDPSGEYGREEDAIRAAVIIAERNAPPEA